MNLFGQADYYLGGTNQVIQEEKEIEKEVRIRLNSLPDEVKEKGEKHTILQGFICVGGSECDVRIRDDGYAGKHFYTMTAKFRPKNHEAETEISKDTYDALWPKATKKQKKTRFVWNGWDIDVFEDGGIIAEFEYTRKTELNVPKHWDVHDEKQETD